MVLSDVSYPSLAVLATAGVTLLVAAAVADVAGFGMVAGFLGMYAMVAFLLSGIAYASLISIKYLSKASQRRRSRV